MICQHTALSGFLQLATEADDLNSLIVRLEAVQAAQDSRIPEQLSTDLCTAWQDVLGQAETADRLRGLVLSLEAVLDDARAARKDADAASRQLDEFAGAVCPTCGQSVIPA